MQGNKILLKFFRIFNARARLGSILFVLRHLFVFHQELEFVIRNEFVNTAERQKYGQLEFGFFPILLQPFDAALLHNLLEQGQQQRGAVIRVQKIFGQQFEVDEPYQAIQHGRADNFGHAIPQFGDVDEIAQLQRYGVHNLGPDSARVVFERLANQSATLHSVLGRLIFSVLESCLEHEVSLTPATDNANNNPVLHTVDIASTRAT